MVIVKAVNVFLKVKCGRLMLTAECTCSEFSTSRKTWFLDLNLHLCIFIISFKNLCRIHMANESFPELPHFYNVMWGFFFFLFFFPVLMWYFCGQILHTNWEHIINLRIEILRKPRKLKWNLNVWNSREIDNIAQATLQLLFKSFVLS